MEPGHLPLHPCLGQAPARWRGACRRAARQHSQPRTARQRSQPHRCARATAAAVAAHLGVRRARVAAGCTSCTSDPG
eukprot:1377202-Prymnesium_polylepis.2